MAFYNRIHQKYLSLIPALFFALIGSADIIVDALNHKLTTGNLLFNAMLFSPLIIRHWLSYIISGTIACLFAGYGFWVLFVWSAKYFEGAHFSNLFETFVIGPLFGLAILLSGLSLVYSGKKISSGISSVH